jgi:OOP family OmpA-OmpF porin
MLNKLALALVMASAAAGAIAQTATEIPAKKGRSAYIEDSNGNIMRTPFGHCWRSALWTPADAVAGCDGELAPPVAKLTAPALVTGTPPAVTTAQPPAVAPKTCDFVATLASDPLFKPRGAALTDAGKKQIDDQVLTKLAGCRPLNGVQVSARGNPVRSSRLSGRRVDVVAAYLAAKGIPAKAAASQSDAACAGAPRSKQTAECKAARRSIEIAARGPAK